MADTLRILAIGDVVGQPGLRALFAGLGDLVRRLGADLVVANAENAADGFGLDPVAAERLFACGVHVITSGNHIWQRREILPMLEVREELLRPENYPPGVPGHGHCIVTVKDTPVAVLNLEGRVNLSPLRDPFAIGRQVLRQARGKARIAVVDFHAESVEEKEALAAWLDGEAAAVYGTHTHVQTADERILTRGTAYIGDLGMTGPKQGVIGMKREISIRRSLTQIPIKMEVENSDGVIMGVLIEVNPADGKALCIQRIAQDA